MKFFLMLVLLSVSFLSSGNIFVKKEELKHQTYQENKKIMSSINKKESQIVFVSCNDFGKCFNKKVNISSLKDNEIVSFKTENRKQGV